MVANGNTYQDVHNEVVAEDFFLLELEVEFGDFWLLGYVLKHPLGNILLGIQGPEKVKLCQNNKYMILSGILLALEFSLESLFLTIIIQKRGYIKAVRS